MWKKSIHSREALQCAHLTWRWLALLLFVAGSAFAEPSLPPESPEADAVAAEGHASNKTDPPTPPNSSCIQRDASGRFMGWMDYHHCVFSGRTLATAVWFDDLFGDWYDDQATLLLSAISEVTFEEGGGPDTRLRLRASAGLPNASHRLRLIVSDDSDDVPGRQEISTRRSRQSAAVRWVPSALAGFKSDLDVGVRGINPPDLFTRLRIRNSWPILDQSVLRFGQTFRYGSESEGSSISQLDVERAIGESAVARFSNVYDYTWKGNENGFLFSHGVSMSHALKGSRSLSYGFLANGRTRPNFRDESYGPWAAYRSSFLRRWLFYELEPRVTYSRDQDWKAVASLLLRLEIQFGRKKPPKAQEVVPDHPPVQEGDERDGGEG